MADRVPYGPRTAAKWGASAATSGAVCTGGASASRPHRTAPWPVLFHHAFCPAPAGTARHGGLCGSLSSACRPHSSPPQTARAPPTSLRPGRSATLSQSPHRSVRGASRSLYLPVGAGVSGGGGIQVSRAGWGRGVGDCWRPPTAGCQAAEETRNQPMVV